MMQCLYNGAKQAAEWLETHSDYLIQRWSCGYTRA
jgi:hypothetical protein